MQIKDIENLAELAKIELTENEKEALLKDMDGILGYVKQIEAVEVEETSLNYTNKNIWREDKIEPRDFSREKIIDQFPDEKDDFVKVKKIL